MSAGWYSYLLWSDYQKKGGLSPQAALENAKEKIERRFQALMQQSSVVQEEKQMLQDSYSLSDERFKEYIEEALSGTNTKYGKMLSEVDQAVARLKALQQKTPLVLDCYNELCSVINLLDNIINIANDDGGITEGSVQQIKNVRKKAEILRAKCNSFHISQGHKAGKGILKGLDSLQGELATTVAGYTLEEFLSLACLTANSFGLSHVSDKATGAFLNTGAKVKTSTLEKDYINMLNAEIQQLNGSQAKADTVRFFRMDPFTGQGEGILNIAYETAQAKNYTDISQVSLGETFTTHSLIDLNFQRDSIFDFFPEEYLINVAAALGSNPREDETDPEILAIMKTRENDPSLEQGELAEHWDDIVKQVSILSAIDAIAGKGILSSAKYYVVRSKGLAEVKVISTYDILQKIQKHPELLHLGGMTTSESKGHASNRYLMSNANKNNFIPGGNRNDNRLKRSTLTWNEVRGIIANTKITIAKLNFASWF